MVAALWVGGCVFLLPQSGRPWFITQLAVSVRLINAVLGTDLANCLRLRAHGDEDELADDKDVAQKWIAGAKGTL
jgi:hypothetical protein